MTRRALALKISLTTSLMLALAVALGACGKYGPPVRSAPREPAEASHTGSGPEPGSFEAPEEERDREEQDP
jgi:hypothetical protein